MQRDSFEENLKMGLLVLHPGNKADGTKCKLRVLGVLRL